MQGSEIYLDLRYLDVALSALKPQAMEGLETMATDGESLFFSAGQVIRVFRNNPAYEPGVPAHDIALYFFTLIFKRKQRYEALESCLRYCSGADH